MTGDTDLAALGRLLANPARATMCTMLLDGRFHTAGELAKASGVVASTASEHLSRLLEGGIIEVGARGRHRYYRLAGSDVASALESLAVVAPHRPVRNLRSASEGDALRRGRTCYDHLAGDLGCRLTDGLIHLGVLTADFAMRDTAPLADLGLAVPTPSRRDLVRPCVDWTERRHHAAGALPAAMAEQLLERSWAVRIGSGRAVQLTEAGQKHLAKLLNAPQSQALSG